VMGYRSVALAWAVGYPLAFAVLATQLFGLIGLGIGRLWRDIRSIVAVVCAALGVGVGVQYAMKGAAPLYRMATVTTVMVVLQMIGFTLLWRWRNRANLPDPASL
jgi:hypothetical protein